MKFQATVFIAICSVRCFAQDASEIEAASLNLRGLPKSLRVVESFPTENPYSEGASLRSRRANYERCSTIYRIWESDINLSLRRFDATNIEAMRSIAPEVVPFQQAISQITSEEQMAALKTAFERRKNRFIELQRQFSKFESQEVVGQLQNQGIGSSDIQRYLKTRGLTNTEYSAELVADEFVTYIRKQNDSEAELVNALEEILNPNQLEEFVQLLLVDRNLLAHPLVVLSLKLSEAQRRHIEASLTQFDKYSREHRPPNEVLAKQETEFRKKHPNLPFVPEYRKDPQLRRLYLAPYSVLTADQFRKAATSALLMGKTESFAKLKERLPPTDLEVLKRVIDDGIKAEQRE